MQHEKEFHFLQMILQRLHVQTLLMYPSETLDWRVDLGLRRILGREDDYRRTFGRVLLEAEPYTIYRWHDIYHFHYLLLCLPSEERRTELLIGPYLHEEPDHQRMVQRAEEEAISQRLFRQLEQFLEQVPVILDDTPLLAVVDAFAQCIWEGMEYIQVDVNLELAGGPAPLTGDPREERDNVALDMALMEERYGSENRLMEAVSKGRYQQAALIMSGMSALAMEARLTDSLRNVKNYMVIFNTLLRKAAERGGVHPLELDRQSTLFARKIETMTATDNSRDIAEEMLRSYCRMVSRQAAGQYSPLVRKAVNQICLDLSADLSLSALAASQNVNASYLSALFRKETGMTVTDFVLQRRMEYARYLLTDTQYQIQTIAQRCGMSDANYFSKVFKRLVGKTPKEYRSLMRLMNPEVPRDPAQKP